MTLLTVATLVSQRLSKRLSAAFGGPLVGLMSASILQNVPVANVCVQETLKFLAYYSRYSCHLGDGPASAWT